MEVWKRKNDGMPDRNIVELVIVIAIVIILSVISVPIYRGYVDKAKWAEGYSLLGTIISAQKAYYSEYGNFLHESNAAHGASSNWTSNETVLGVDARGNKYFTLFSVNWNLNVKEQCFAGTDIPAELKKAHKILSFRYYINGGSSFIEINP